MHAVLHLFKSNILRAFNGHLHDSLLAVSLLIHLVPVATLTIDPANVMLKFLSNSRAGGSGGATAASENQMGQSTSNGARSDHGAISGFANNVKAKEAALLPNDENTGDLINAAKEITAVDASAENKDAAERDAAAAHDEALCEGLDDEVTLAIKRNQERQRAMLVEYERRKAQEYW